jgi:RHS repeat-associated protein
VRGAPGDGCPYRASTTGGGAGGEGWYLQWNGENRLIAAEKSGAGVPPAEAITLNFAYDHQGRRISKTVSTGETSFAHTYLYDGWNLIQESTTTGAATPSSRTNHYVWGLDLSGTLQGAGGIGGLLTVTRTGDATPSSRTYAPAYDANGNITEYVDLADGTIVAHYQYDAFGNTITQSGSEASSFPHRFSTKYTDDETGFLYYGYRYYSPELGRWVNRDPIGM